MVITMLEFKAYPSWYKSFVNQQYQQVNPRSQLFIYFSERRAILEGTPPLVSEALVHHNDLLSFSRNPTMQYSISYEVFTVHTKWFTQDMARTQQVSRAQECWSCLISLEEFKKIIRTSFPHIKDILHKHWIHKASTIIEAPSHSTPGLFVLFQSGKRYKSLQSQFRQAQQQLLPRGHQDTAAHLTPYPFPQLLTTTTPRPHPLDWHWSFLFIYIYIYIIHLNHNYCTLLCHSIYCYVHMHIVYKHYFMSLHTCIL